MPTVIHFVGAEEPITLDDDYEKVTARLHGAVDAVQFTRAYGDSRSLVTIYKSAIAYIEGEASGAELQPYALGG